MPFTVIRHYRDSTKLIDELAQRKDEVESLIRGISGFVAYYLVRSETGGFTVSVYEDRAGAEESIRAARDYLQKNLSGVSSVPEVLQGETVFGFSA